MTVHINQHIADEPNTYEALIQFWQSVDEPLTQDDRHELWRPRTPRIIVATRCFYVFIVLTTLACLPTALRAVGRSLE